MKKQPPKTPSLLPLDSTPRVRSRWRLECLAPNLAVFLSEHGDRILEGELVYELAKRINGRCTLEDLVKRLGRRFSSANVEKTAQRLAQGGFIEASAISDPPLPKLNLNWLENVGPPALVDRLPPFNSLCLGQVPAEEIRAELTECGLKPTRRASFSLVWCDDYLHPELSDFNRKQLKNRRSWMLVKPVGAVLWLGPIFQPETACWECLAQRLRANQPVRQFLHLRRLSKDCFLPPQPYTRLSCRIACRLALGELTSRIEEGLSKAASSLWSLDVVDLTAQRHPVVRWPGCAACGPGWEPVENESPFVNVGSPSHEIADRQRLLVSPITGVVRFLQPAVREARSGVWLSMAANPAARVAKDWDRMKQSLTRCCAGSAPSRQEAETAAFCEAIERYSGVFQGCEKRRKASLRQLGESAVHPNDCMLFSHSQYRRRQWWNRREANFNWVPNPFREDAVIEWTPLWSLTHRRVRYLPTGMCYYGYPSHRSPFYRPDSNGCAVGPSLEEAVVRGFLELVERDAVAIWWYNRIARPAIELKGDWAVFAKNAARRFQSLDWNLHLLDLTHDLTASVAAAVLWRLRGKTLRVACGFAARFSLRQAVRRAICELSQFVEPFADDGPPAPGVFELHRDEGDYLLPSPASRTAEKSSARPNLESCLEICRRRGLEMLVLNLTRPDAAMPAAKVAAPGLRPFWPRFRHGRLFQTPVEMGWLRHPLSEEDLNPLHLNC